MTNENETVERIHDELKRDPLAPNGAKPWTHYLADRIIAAHKREIAAKDDERLTVVANYEAVIAAKDRIIAARDAEIEKLKFEIMTLKSEQHTAGEVIIEQTNKVESKDAEIASLRALVKELADNALLLKDEVCVGCPQKLSVCGEQKCSLVKNTDALVAKAREVCK